MSLVIPDEVSKSPLHVGIEGITSEDISEEMSSNSFSVAGPQARGTLTAPRSKMDITQLVSSDVGGPTLKCFQWGMKFSGLS